MSDKYFKILTNRKTSNGGTVVSLIRETYICYMQGGNDQPDRAGQNRVNPEISGRGKRNQLRRTTEQQALRATAFPGSYSHNRVMIDIETFRTLALSFPDTEERPYFHLPSFGVKNRIFATLREKENRAMLKLPLADPVGHTFCSIAVGRTSHNVHFGFYRGSRIADPKHMFLGEGKQYRYILVKSTDDFPVAYMKKLLKEACANSLAMVKEKRQLVEGKTITKSISPVKRKRGKNKKYGDMVEVPDSRQ